MHAQSLLGSRTFTSLGCHSLPSHLLVLHTFTSSNSSLALRLNAFERGGGLSECKM